MSVIPAQYRTGYPALERNHEIFLSQNVRRINIDLGCQPDGPTPRPPAPIFSYGSEVSTTGLRQINVNDSNHAIDVNKGETVELVSGAAHEEWRFDGVQPEFTLAHVLPQRRTCK